MPLFYSECNKVLSHSGTIAIWGYGNFVFSKYPELTKLHHEYSTKFLKSYWEPGRNHLVDLYQDQSFIVSPYFTMERYVFPDQDKDPILEVEWSLAQIEGYLKTWSAYQSFKKQRPDDPDPISRFVGSVKGILKTDSMDTRLHIYWPIGMILGKRSSSFNE